MPQKGEFGYALDAKVCFVSFRQCELCELSKYGFLFTRKYTHAFCGILKKNNKLNIINIIAQGTQLRDKLNQNTEKVIRLRATFKNDIVRYTYDRRRERVFAEDWSLHSLLPGGVTVCSLKLFYAAFLAYLYASITRVGVCS